jgi:hypothetical protein
MVTGTGFYAMPKIRADGLPLMPVCNHVRSANTMRITYA